MGSTFIAVLVGFLPVLLFLGGLVYVDTFKLVRLRNVLLTIVAGGSAAGIALVANSWLIDLTRLSLVIYSRYCSPFLEEFLKAAYLVYLLRSNRVGFMVDAAIRGVALGAGFALVENLYYLSLRPDADPYLWVIRGFGTAIMHGGATAVTGILAQGIGERSGRVGVNALVPALAVAVALHSLFNHFFVNPLFSTIIVLTVVPAVVLVVFRRSEVATRRWLGIGFDTDRELLEMITTGVLAETRIGRYLESMEDRFPGEIVADMLCYLRLHLELSIRAKGMLLMRDAGFEIPPDAEAEDHIAEIRYLEKNIGRTGMIALHPFLRARTKDLWQIMMLKS